jgi:hypothetical protein
MCVREGGGVVAARTRFDLMQMLYGTADGNVRVHVVDGAHREAGEARKPPMHRRLTTGSFSRVQK